MTVIGHNRWLSVNINAGDSTNFSTPLNFTSNLTDSIDLLEFHAAADYTAKLISKRYNNIHLMLSGGLDSEYVASVLIRSNIKFTPIIILTPNVDTEPWYAFKFCDENKLSPLVLDYTATNDYVNLIDQVVSKAEKLKVPCVSGLLSNVVIDILGNDIKILNGFGEPFYDSADYREKTSEVLELCYHQHFTELEHGDSHPGAFFTYTPELVKSSMLSITTDCHSQLAKAKLYNVLPRAKMYYDIFKDCPDVKLKLRINKTRFPITPDTFNLSYCQMSKTQWLQHLFENTNV